MFLVVTAEYRQTVWVNVQSLHSSSEINYNGSFFHSPEVPDSPFMNIVLFYVTSSTARMTKANTKLEQQIKLIHIAQKYE
jgi:hypothetical protein